MRSVTHKRFQTILLLLHVKERHAMTQKAIVLNFSTLPKLEPGIPRTSLVSRQGCLTGRDLHSAAANSRLFLGRRPNASHQTYPAPPKRSHSGATRQLGQQVDHPSRKSRVKWCRSLKLWGHTAAGGTRRHADSNETARKRSVPGGVATRTRRSCPTAFGPASRSIPPQHLLSTIGRACRTCSLRCVT